MFIEPDLKIVRSAKKLNADNIELHTGKFCKFFKKISKLDWIILEFKIIYWSSKDYDLFVLNQKFF